MRAARRQVVAVRRDAYRRRDARAAAAAAACGAARAERRRTRRSRWPAATSRPSVARAPGRRPARSRRTRRRRSARPAPPAARARPSRRPTRCSVQLPARCPNWSLTDLKWSRSMNSIASSVPSRSARPISSRQPRVEVAAVRQAGQVVDARLRPRADGVQRVLDRRRNVRREDAQQLFVARRVGSPGPPVRQLQDPADRLAHDDRHGHQRPDGADLGASGSRAGRPRPAGRSAQDGRSCRRAPKIRGRWGAACQRRSRCWGRTRRCRSAAAPARPPAWRAGRPAGCRPSRWGRSRSPARGSRATCRPVGRPSARYPGRAATRTKKRAISSGDSV